MYDTQDAALPWRSLYCRQSLVLFSLFVLCLVPPALAIMSDSGGPRTTADDTEYSAGLEAVKRAAWQVAIEHMQRVVERRPWHDDAHNVLGYANRQLGHYQRALVHYQQALTLNPYHRGALEYLGETYLAMGCMAQARQTLARLAMVCQQLTNAEGNNAWQTSCPEWQELQTAIETYRGELQEDCTEQESEKRREK